MIHSWPLPTKKVIITKITAEVAFFVAKHYSIFLGVVKVNPVLRYPETRDGYWVGLADLDLLVTQCLAVQAPNGLASLVLAAVSDEGEPLAAVVHVGHSAVLAKRARNLLIVHVLVHAVHE